MKKVVLSMFITVVFFFFGGIKVTNSYAAEAEFKFRLSHFLAPNSLFGIGLQDYANDVEKRTNGRVKITVFPGATLSNPVQTYDAVTKGVADLGYSVFAYHRGRLPLMEVLDLPLGVMGPAECVRMLNAFYKKFKPKELDDVKVIFLDGSGPGVIGSKKMLTKISDIKGLKVRSTGTSGKMVEVLGGSPVGIPITDTFDALSKGVIDATTNDAGAIASFGLNPVLKNHLVTPAIAYCTSLYLVMNKEKWNSLPKDIQMIIDKLDEEWIEKLVALRLKWAKEGEESAKKNNIQITTFSKEDDATAKAKIKVILDEYVKNTNAKGLPGDEALKFCQNFAKKPSKK